MYTRLIMFIFHSTELDKTPPNLIQILITCIDVLFIFFIRYMLLYWVYFLYLLGSVGGP